MVEEPRNERVGGMRARISEMTEIPRLLPGELNQLRIVHPLMRDTAMLEAFRELDRRLTERAEGRNFLVGVVPIVPGCGASFVSLNLASTISIDHHRTALLVECGPENDTIRKLLMLPPESGLLEYLSDPGREIETIIYSSRNPRLRIVPYGNLHTGMGLLGSAAMQHLLNDLKSRYSDRFIVLDFPHVAPPDAWQRLAQWSDFVVLVVPYGDVSVSQVSEAVETFGREKVAGVVLNRDPAVRAPALRP
jgi:Mrp family chromosome partitioning ATPase